MTTLRMRITTFLIIEGNLKQEGRAGQVQMQKLLRYESMVGEEKRGTRPPLSMRTTMMLFSAGCKRSKHSTPKVLYRIHTKQKDGGTGWVRIG